MPPVKKTSAPSNEPPPRTPAEIKWEHQCEIMKKFRKLCHSDKHLFQQAEDRIKAKRVAAAWESRDKTAIDVMAVSKQMVEYVLDEEDQRQADALYRKKIAFRDRLCAVLGKRPDEGWDAFHERHSTIAKIPNTARQFELAEGATK